MTTFKDWAPTQFDAKGLGLDDRQDWIVAPVVQTRDSGTLERSNFEVVEKGLDAKQGQVELHRFGHWGPGWYEILLVEPNTEAAEACIEWEAALADYSVACEEHFSRLEYEEVCENWESMSLRERISQCSHVKASIFAARRDNPYDVTPDCGRLTDLLRNL